MATIQVEAHVSTDQLLRAVEQISEQELDIFVAHVLALRAKRAASHLNTDESTPLVRIDRSLSPISQEYYAALVAKRDAETLTFAEQHELIKLTDQIEQQDADRLEALAQLAQLRETTINDVMQTLGIKPPAYG